MSTEMKAIKIKIGLAGGQAKYPDFNKLQAVKDSGIDWSFYVDQYGIGWLYDRTCGHKECSVDSPHGQQWGVLVVPPAFADEALTMFPDDITEIDETELTDFHDNKCMIDVPENNVNETVLNSLQKELELTEKLGGDTTDLKAKVAKAIDPEDTEPGIKKNPQKKWTDRKAIHDITIKKA